MQAALLRKQKLPAWYFEEPELLPLNEFYMRAFWELNTERPSSFTIGAIPVSKIREHGQNAGLSERLMPEFVGIVRAMDEAYIKWVRENSKVSEIPDRD